MADFIPLTRADMVAHFKRFHALTQLRQHKNLKDIDAYLGTPARDMQSSIKQAALDVIQSGKRDQYTPYYEGSAARPDVLAAIRTNKNSRYPGFFCGKGITDKNIAITLSTRNSLFLSFFVIANMAIESKREELSQHINAAKQQNNFSVALALAEEANTYKPTLLIDTPYWNTTIPIAENAGFQIELLARNQDGSVDYLGLEEQAQTADCMCIATPGNPTGNIRTAEEIAREIKIYAKYNVPVVQDVAYEEFRANLNHELPLYAQQYENTITAFNLSKTFAMTGWPVSYMVAPAELIQKINGLQVAGHLPGNFLQDTILASFQVNPDDIRQMAEKQQTQNNRMAEAFTYMGLPCTSPNGGMYVTPDVGILAGKTAVAGDDPDLAALRLEKMTTTADVVYEIYRLTGYKLQCGDVFQMTDKVRIATCLSIEDNTEGLYRLEYFMKHGIEQDAPNPEDIKLHVHSNEEEWTLKKPLTP